MMLKKFEIGRKEKEAKKEEKKNKEKYDKAMKTVSDAVAVAGISVLYATAVLAAASSEYSAEEARKREQVKNAKEKLDAMCLLVNSGLNPTTYEAELKEMVKTIDSKSKTELVNYTISLYMPASYKEYVRRFVLK